MENYIHVFIYTENVFLNLYKNSPVDRKNQILLLTHFKTSEMYFIICTCFLMLFFSCSNKVDKEVEGENNKWLLSGLCKVNICAVLVLNVRLPLTYFSSMSAQP